MRRNGAVKAIALLLSVGMVAGLAGTYLAEAGVPLWIVGLAVLVVLAVPVVAAVRADRKR